MARKQENQGFLCINCNKNVEYIKNGSIRNHCPFCLFSVHLDIKIGDRASDCFGIMQPISVIYNSKKGYQIIHKCLKCSKNNKNILADDDNKDVFFNIFKEISIYGDRH